MKSKQIDFTPPEKLLENVGNVPSGSRVELMTSYAVKPDGRWCIVNWEGVPAPGYDADGDEENDRDDAPAPTGKFVDTYQQAMG